MTRLPAVLWRVVPVTLWGGIPVGAAAAQGLEHRHYQGRPEGPVLDRAELDPILEVLIPREPQSLLDRLMDWLDELFRDRSDPTVPDWVSNFRIPELPWDWILWGSCTLILLLSVGIIVNELRIRGAARTVAARQRRTVEFQALEPLTLDSVLALPLQEQPAALLHLLLDGLNLSGVTSSGSLTHREISSAAEGLPAQRGEPLQRIARTAEQIRYAAATPEPEEIQSTVAAGRRVAEELGA